MRKLMIVLTVAALAVSAQAAGLYFTASGNDLVITAKEAGGTQYWSLQIDGGVTLAGDKTDGMLSGFYDLTGDAGSVSTYNLAAVAGFDRAMGLLSTTDESNIGARSNLQERGGVVSMPEYSSLVDGGSSYSFSVTLTTADKVVTSIYTINAPTATGTQFVADNSIQIINAVANGETAMVVSCGLMPQAETDLALASYDGWQDSPKNNTQWASATATATAASIAEGREFLLTQIAEDVTTPGTASSYEAAAAGYDTTYGYNRLSSWEQLSGTYRGTGTTGETYDSTGTLDINIAAAPEPATMIIMAAGIPILLKRRHKRR